MDLVAAEHGVRHTVEITDGIAALKTNVNDAGPNSTLKEARQGTLREFAAVAGCLFDEFA